MEHIAYVQDNIASILVTLVVGAFVWRLWTSFNSYKKEQEKDLKEQINSAVSDRILSIEHRVGIVESDVTSFKSLELWADMKVIKNQINVMQKGQDEIKDQINMLIKNIIERK